MKKYIRINKILVVMFLLSPLLSLIAQDAAKVDPAHYKVEMENDLVRVLRINYKPGDESTMHSHPQGIAVFLTEHSAEMKTGNGQTLEINGNAGDVIWVDKAEHQPKNTGSNAFELIQIELKNQAGTSKKKSLHLFDLPEGISEKKLNDFLKDMNKAISEEGYPEAGYHLYKITDDNDDYKYFMEGVWPDAATYEKIHDSEKWKAAADKGRDMIEKIQAQELYLKAEKVN